MLNVRQNKVEVFFDLLDQSAMIYYNKAKKSYLDALLITCDNIVKNDVQLEDLMSEDIETLNEMYASLNDESFNREEIRRAFQLTLFKALKHLDVALSDITPDTIGLLFSHFIDILLKDKHSVNVLDATCGSGNLLFSMLNNSDLNIDKIYGVDLNSSYINVALKLANLLDYDVEFFNQNNLKNMLVPNVDLVIGDLPIDKENDFIPSNLITAKNKTLYRPFLMVENLMNYCESGGYMIYLIPNDFFTHEKNRVIKDILLNSSYIQALIELPIDLFKDPRYQKSILILRKKGEDVKPTKDILMLRFPSFKDPNKVTNAIAKIERWFSNLTK